MKKIAKKLALILTMMFLFQTTAAVVNEPLVITSYAAGKTVTITKKTTKITGYVGDKITLKLNNKSGKQVTWDSADSKSKLYSLTKFNNKKGVVLLRRAGTAVIKVSFGGTTYKVKITIKENFTEPESAVSVLDYGATANDGTDDTQAINDAIKAVTANGGGTVYIPAGTFNIDATREYAGPYAKAGILLESNLNLVMNPSTVLQVAANSAEGYDVLIARHGSNISVSGGKIAGERSNHTGSAGYAGMGIGIYDSSNVTISNVDIADCWGDGIYIGRENDNNSGCNGVTVVGCNITNNRRSDISIVDGDNVTIDSCFISVTKSGVAPQSGINIEPNAINGKVSDAEICHNVTFKNTRIVSPKSITTDGQFMCFRTQYYLDSTTSCKKFTITNCYIKGDCGNYSARNATIKNSVITGYFGDKCGTKIKNSKVGKIERF